MLSLKEENKKMRELRNLCKDLGVMSPPDITLELILQDSNKNIIQQNNQRAHSLTRNALNSVFVKETNSNYTSSNFGAGYISFKNKDGNNAGPPNSNFFYSNAGLNSKTGLLVSSSDTAFNINDYTDSFYSTSILIHQAMSRSSSYNSVTHKWIFVLSRVFVNNSGITRLINSTGLFTNSNYLMERTVLDDTIEMVDSAMLTVNYSISMDFSAIDS
jgi:hypothetical protein